MNDTESHTGAAIMGTRKSRHNKGRKPFYKEHNSALDAVWSKRIWLDMSARTGNSLLPEQIKQIRSLFAAGLSIRATARKLSISKDTANRYYHRFKEDFKCGCGRSLTHQGACEWRQDNNPAYQKLRLQQREAFNDYPLQQREAFNDYPYINKVRPEHADIIEINKLVPRTFPNHIRADICQEIALAIIEGKTTIQALREKKAEPSYFIKKFWHDNYEDTGRAISFQEEWDSDDVASSIAGKEWFREQFSNRSVTLNTSTPPTQFETTYRKQIRRIVIKSQVYGDCLSEEEVEEMFSDSV